MKESKIFAHKNESQKKIENETKEEEIKKIRDSLKYWISNQLEIGIEMDGELIQELIDNFQELIDNNLDKILEQCRTEDTPYRDKGEKGIKLLEGNFEKGYPDIWICEWLGNRNNTKKDHGIRSYGDSTATIKILRGESDEEVYSNEYAENGELSGLNMVSRMGTGAMYTAPKGYIHSLAGIDEDSHFITLQAYWPPLTKTDFYEKVTSKDGNTVLKHKETWHKEDQKT